ncbi:hypothetical protein PIROE2DRAFT_17270 [Piromyces sp. E2]|nr:hypothetical protein PIROE2DRAFT_17270 [Piromyces sp. E2]|eukprot:OUM57671.1 hypothetical protein PIROE2DRAFT_17270 [Piromyces sp. E2]
MFIIIFKLLFLFCFSKLICNIICVDIHNESEFIQYTENDKKEQILNIHGEIVINSIDTIIPAIKNITIIGSSKKESIIKFKNNNEPNIVFPSQCEYIFFENIHLIGNILFVDNKYINFKNVIYNGYFISEHTYRELDSKINIYECDFILPNISQGYEVINYDMDIYNSTFFGNDVYDAVMVKFESNMGYNNTIFINLSVFDGNYHNSAIHSSYSNTTIFTSIFQNTYNGEKLKGGGALTSINSYNNLYNVTFENNFSRYNGGSITFIDTYSTYITYGYFYNSTSGLKGNIFSAYGENNESNVVLREIYQYGNCTNHKYNVEGSIFSLTGPGYIYMKIYYGKNVCFGDAIHIEGDGKVGISGFYVEDIYSKYENSFIKTSNPETKGPNISITDCLLKNIYHNHEFYSALLISINSGIGRFEK